MKKVFRVLLSLCLVCGIMPTDRALAFSQSDISAGSAILVEAESGRVIFEKNAYERRPMASTTKIMSTILSIESGDLDTRFTVDSEAIKVEGSSMGLVEGDSVTKRDLCYGMMLPSGNDAANATAVKVAGNVDAFVRMMNDKASEIGLSDTHFVTPSGLDDYTDDHYSTAYDMAMLARYAMQNEIFCEICGTESACLEYGNPPYKRWLTNTNKLLKTCEGVCGVKTGFTDKAGRCLVSACERDGVKLICVTLNAPNDWQDHNRLYNFGFSKLVNTELPCDYYGFNVDVVGGKIPNIICSVEEKPRATMYVTEADNVTSEVILPRFLYAPVVQNEKVGEIRFYSGEIEVACVDIIAKEFVEAKEPEEKSLLERIKDKFIFEW